MNTNILYVCAVLGLLDTAYLIYHKVRGTDVACIFFPKAWCKKVQYSKQSKTLGIPNSIAGFGMYAFILLAAVMFARGVWPSWPLTGVITFGFLFSMYFTYVQAFVLRAFCTWCVLSAINFTILFLAAWNVVG